MTASVVDSPRTYSGLMRVLGADEGMARLVHEHLRVRPGYAVLDVGCGTGRLFPHLPPVTYVGVDLDARRVARARALHPRGRFEVGNAGGLDGLQGPFDLVLMIGLLHHLPDPAAARAVALAHDRLRPGGRLVTLDCAIEQGQGLAASLLARLDRGCFVRGGRAYLELVRARFEGAGLVLRGDLLRVPYLHAIVEGRKS